MDQVIHYAQNPEKTTEASRKKLHEIEGIVDYAADDLKTERCTYVTGIHLDSVETAAAEFMEVKQMEGKLGGRVCYHGYQSFREDEVDAATAHKIGVALASELWGDRFQVVVATHCNTNHYHNHFVLNSVSDVDGLKFYNSPADYRRMREVSDRLCKEYGLSVIKYPEGKGKNYGELVAEKEGKPTRRGIIKADLDRAIEASLTEQEFWAKPGYNVNVATVSEYIIGNYISADRTDTKTFIPFLEKLCRKHPVKRVVVDSGYESEENYHYVDGSEQLSLFVKPSNHEQKKKRKYKNDIGRRENMAYDAGKDEYTCAQGQKLQAVAVKKRKSETGYVQEVTVYECAGCKDCPVKEKCIRQKKTDKTPLADRAKRLNVSKYFIAQREAMEKKISTEEGILLRVNRSIQSEGVFAMIKEDMNFRRFLTRGNSNVMVEWYLVSMAYNLLKLHHKIQTGRLGKHLIVPTVA